MGVYPSKYAAIPLGDLENMNTDREVFPPTMLRGVLAKTSAGAWVAQEPMATEETLENSFINWDTITPTFNATSDVYQFYLNLVLVKTITVNYTDATKTVMSGVTKV